MDDLERIDLNLLHALAYLLETRSVTEAARRARVSQPAMSRSLARLRGLFDDPLLVQVGRKLEPTERARALRPVVEDALTAVRHAFKAADAFDPATTAFEARFAANDYAVKALLLPWLAAVRPGAKGLALRIEPASLH